MNKENNIWKQRYDSLKQFIADAEFDIRKQEFERCKDRAWDPPEEVFISFSGETCDTEEVAIKLYGKDNYDVYKLLRKSRK
jgi:hypothetical protein